MAVQTMSQTFRPTDAWKPFLKVVGYQPGYTSDARGVFANKASKVIANLLPLALETGTRSSDDSQTLLSVSLEGLPDGDMEVNYQAFGEWLADGGLESRGENPPSVWVQHCVHVLYHLFQQHSFFVCKNMHRHDNDIYGFGPRDLVKDDMVVDSDVSSRKHAGNSMGFSVRPIDNGAMHRLIGSCWILGQQDYDEKGSREFLLAMPGELQTFLDRNRGESRTSELKGKTLELKDRLLGRLSPNSV